MGARFTLMVAIAAILVPCARGDAAWAAQTTTSGKPTSAYLQTVLDVSKISAEGVEVDLVYRSEPLPRVAGEDHWEIPRLRIYANHRLAVDDPLPVDARGFALPIEGPKIVLAGDGTHEVQLLVTVPKPGREKYGYELIAYHVQRDLRSYRRTVRAASSFTSFGLVPGLPCRPEGYRIAKAGDVHVELTFEPAKSRFSQPILLRISRRGVAREYGLITQADGSNYEAVNGPFIVDLNADGQLELVFTALSAGASCCGYSVIYAYDPAIGNYQHFDKMWGKYTNSARLFHPPGERAVAFWSNDENFADANGVPYPGLAISPLQLWKFQGGHFIDVTRSYPGLIERDAWEAWKVLRDGKETYLHQAACGWYLADKYLLGEGDMGWQIVAARCPNDLVDRLPVPARFYSLLRRNLREFGYQR